MKAIRSSAALLAERRLGASVHRAITIGASRATTTTNGHRAICRSNPNLPGPSRRHYSTHPPAAPTDAIPEISQSDSFDIVIIGGGNAGLALACALCQWFPRLDGGRILIFHSGPTHHQIDFEDPIARGW
jgi:ubiquinone biosynthesis monooxygenase Coq6